VELALAAQAAGAHTFVFLSSIAAIGFPAEGGLMAPDHPCAPTSLYGRSKRDAELALLRLAPELRVVVVRPATVYGPGERRNFLALTRAVAAGRVFLPGAADNRMSFCHLSNLVDAVARLVETGEARGILHVADDPTPTFEQAVSTIARSLGRPPPRLRLPLALAKSLAFMSEVGFGAVGRAPPLSRARLRTLTADAALDVSKTHALGIVPQVSFEEGVRRTVAWYQSEKLVGPC
jgi:UDP-glucose 4-epimerase